MVTLEKLVSVVYLELMETRYVASLKLNANSKVLNW